jgi:hypothetical protein
MTWIPFCFGKGFLKPSSLSCFRCQGERRASGGWLMYLRLRVVPAEARNVVEAGEE